MKPRKFTHIRDRMNEFHYCVEGHVRNIAANISKLNVEVSLPIKKLCRIKAVRLAFEALAGLNQLLVITGDWPIAVPQYVSLHFIGNINAYDIGNIIHYGHTLTVQPKTIGTVKGFQLHMAGYTQTTTARITEKNIATCTAEIKEVRSSTLSRPASLWISPEGGGVEVQLHKCSLSLLSTLVHTGMLQLAVPPNAQ